MRGKMHSYLQDDGCYALFCRSYEATHGNMIAKRSHNEPFECDRLLVTDLNILNS